MDDYIVPYINISMKNSTLHTLQHIVDTIGKIKDSINLLQLIDSPHIRKNLDFVELVKSLKNEFIPMPNYYNEDVQDNFDIYGSYYEEIHGDNTFVIKIYFYKIKNPELLTQQFIEKFKLIFQYDYFTRHNILNMDWHSYRLNLFTNDIEKQKFLNLAYSASDYCKTKLFSHQINNISCMLDIYKSPIKIPITNNLIMKFNNGIVYDFVTNKFIEESHIPTYQINSGMILDEPGTGKSLQFILFALELNKKTLILVPNELIKKVWYTEFEKHMTIKINQTPIEIMTFSDLKSFIDVDKHILDNFEIIGIDEIHIMYTKEMELFKKIVKSNIKSRWGITGTPFINEQSLFNIVKFLSGQNFTNERLSNSPYLQNMLIKLFLKNLKINMIDDYDWPELKIHNVFVTLDKTQRDLYDTELKTTFNKQNLRKIISEVQLMFNDHIKTPADLKAYGAHHYKKLYETEILKMEELTKQLDNIIKNEDKFDQLEFINRQKHYKYLIENQKEVVKRHKSGYEYFMKSIDDITNIFKNKEMEDNCTICLNEHEPPIKYLKTCGHYFCGMCIDQFLKRCINIKCPICRTETTIDNIITVQEVSEINNSPKIHEIIKFISESDSKFIVFSQFNVLDKFCELFNKRSIVSTQLNEYIGGQDCQVLLLSSEKNAEGINLSEFDKLIIFEPFEDHVYCKEIEKQLIGRIHRIGRTKEVDVIRLITKDTIEEEIYYQC
jgi:SNF2 family DNA or RNA helicase